MLKPAIQNNSAEFSKQQSFILKDDLKGLTGAEKTKFYLDLCDFLGLSPITKPFGIYEFQGKETLYIKADAFDQLCAKNKVSRKIVPQEVITQHGIIKQDFALMGEGNEQTYLVKVEASILIDGEKVIAEDIAEVMVKEEKYEWKDSKKISKGYMRNTNALMKAITKAYRRAAKKLISIGAVILEDDLQETNSIRDINLSTGDVIGGSNTKNILDVALPKTYKGFVNLKDLDLKDSELTHGLYEQLKEKHNKNELAEEWKTVLSTLENYFSKLQ